MRFKPKSLNLMMFSPLYGFIASLLTVTVLSCQAQQAKPSSFTDATGVLLVSVYSRGAYQYMLAVPDANSTTRYYPVNLTDSLKQQALKAGSDTPLQVRFSGRLTGKKEVMKRTTADDRGEAAGELPQITLTAITVRK